MDNGFFFMNKKIPRRIEPGENWMKYDQISFFWKLK